MTTALLLGGVLMLLAVTDTAVRRLPLSPALLYLGIGWIAGALLGSPGPETMLAAAPHAVGVTELVVLVSLVAVGLRLRVPPRLGAWAVALRLAGPGMVATMLFGACAAAVVLGLPWPAALLLAAILAPTDPVLASEVQIRSGDDRDAVRLSLSAEGGLNDGTALPGVMLALGMLGLHTLGPWGSGWWWHDLVWPIGGGVAVGVVLGLGLGQVMLRRLAAGDPLARDELIYVGTVVLGYGVAQLTRTSTFVVAFCMGATLLMPLGRSDPGLALSDRLHAFGARIERLVESAMVLAIGVALHGIWPSPLQFVFAVVLVMLVRPLAVFAVVRGAHMPGHQRRLIAWFGIRGIGSLFYLAFALEHGVGGALAHTLVATTLACIAVSIVSHGVSATPLMTRYQRRGARRPPSHGP